MDVQIDDFEILIVSGLQERATAEHIKDEDELFCSSLIAQLTRLTRKENCLAKMKIQQVLFDAEFTDNNEI